MKIKDKYCFLVALIYLGFFALIALAVYWSGRLLPLWALFLMPSFEAKGEAKQ